MMKQEYKFYHNKAAEVSVIGSLMINGENITRIYDLLNPVDFYNSRNGRIFNVITMLFNKTEVIDLLTVGNKYIQVYPEDTDGIHYYLSQCIEQVPSHANLEYYAKIVKQEAKKRQFIKTLTTASKTDLTDDNFEEVVLQTLKECGEIINDNTINYEVDFVKEIDNIKTDITNQLNGNYKEKKNNFFNYPSKKLTLKTGGIEIPSLTVIGALKKTGKTKLLIDIIHNLYFQDIATLFFSLEMKDKRIMRWLISRFGLINSNHIRNPLTIDNQVLLTPQELERTEKESSVLKNAYQNDKLIVNTKKKISIQEIKCQIYLAKQRNPKLKVVLIDYLQRCDMGIFNEPGKNTAKVIEDFMSALADISGELDVAIIILSQMSNIAEGEYATIEHFKHSGGISEAVDVAIVMNRLSRIDPDNKSKELHYSIWQREGAGGKVISLCDLTCGVYSDQLSEFDEINIVNEFQAGDNLF